MSSPGSSRSSGTKRRSPSSNVRQLIDALVTHRVNTLTELCRVEQAAAACDNVDDARAFQAPMTAAWHHYVASHQLLTELRGLTPSYPFSGALLEDAQARVRADPDSNRSWNLAWLCLAKMCDDGLIAAYAAAEAVQPEMWMPADADADADAATDGIPCPTADEVAQLARCFELEWTQAVSTLLRHWPTPPTWY